MNLITSLNNSKIKEYRALKHSSIRKDRGIFLVEGIKHIGEAFEAIEAGKNFKLDALIFSPEKLKSKYAWKMIDQLQSSEIPCLAVSEKVINSLSDKDDSQGVIAVVKHIPPNLNNFYPQIFPFAVALVNPQDPGNVGTILRTIDAVGACGLILLDSGLDTFHPNLLRASMGMTFWYPVIRADSLVFYNWVKKHNYFVLGTSAHADDNYFNVKKFEFPLIILAGNEREGLTEKLLSFCDQVIKLPMMGRSSSLNLGVAVSIILYTIIGQDDKDCF